MIDGIGWLSSAILLLTISTQVHRQWASGTSKGVSTWLFIGQFVASSGFFTYSLLQHDWVFIVTNGLMGVAAIVGYAIVRIHRRRESRASKVPQASSTSAARAPFSHGAAIKGP
ncbi:MAG: hypothetical protein JWN04_3103 [Myxococcaceae bacterium]|nr:hypothetical protein [Myxococcaceae bacterium]